MDKDTALRLALEALELHGKQYPHMVKGYCLDAITALRQALSEEQESVALETVYETIIHWDENGGKRSRRELARRIVDLYSTPPPVAEPHKRTWVGLTDEEYLEAESVVWITINLDSDEKEANRDFYQAIEAKLKEKNT